MASHYDGAWKELLHTRFQELLAAYFPKVAKAIDWKKSFRFLDQELRALGIEEDPSDNRVDIVAEVFLLDGSTEIIFLHVEVQSFVEADFPARLFRCNHQLRSSLGHEVVTLAILADLDPGWTPFQYHWERLGCEISFTFPTCKLLARLPEFEARDDFAGLAAVAQIEALRTSRHPDKRLAARTLLSRALFKRGWTRAQIREALALLARMMRLPKTELLTFRKSMAQCFKENAMPTLTDIEELAMEEGLEKGRQEGRQEGRQDAIVQLLKTRFRRVPTGLIQAIREVSSDKKLDKLIRAAALASDIEEFSKAL